MWKLQTSQRKLPRVGWKYIDAQYLAGKHKLAYSLITNAEVILMFQSTSLSCFCESGCWFQLAGIINRPRVLWHRAANLQLSTIQSAHSPIRWRSPAIIIHMTVYRRLALDLRLFALVVRVFIVHNLLKHLNFQHVVLSFCGAFVGCASDGIKSS